MHGAAESRRWWMKRERSDVMENTFAFFGNAAVGGAVERLVANAGWQRVEGLEDVAAVVTYCTNQQMLEDARNVIVPVDLDDCLVEEEKGE